MKPKSKFAIKRKNQRVPTPAGMWVTWKLGKQRSTSRVLNFSASGAYIESHETVAVGTGLKLFFAMAEGEIQLEAVVRSSQVGKGMGVEFVTMSTKQFEFVLKVAKRLLASYGLNPISDNPKS